MAPTNSDTSGLRDKLATQAEQTPASGNGGAVEKVGVDVLVRDAIARQASAFEAVLPSVADPTRFARLALTAIKSTPELMRCFETKQGEISVLLAAMQAAALGLEPNTPTQDCWLLPRKNKGVTECQLSIGYRGYQKLARRSGTIKTLFAEVVYERDHFRWERGLEEDVLEHRPFEGGERGALTHAYAVVRYLNGGYNFIVLNRADVEARRAKSDSWSNEKARPFSPWTQWPAAMWKKSAVRALMPYVDLSPDVERAVATDEARLAVNRDEGVIEAAAGGPFELEAGPDPDDEPDGPDGGGAPEPDATEPAAPADPPVEAETPPSTGRAGKKTAEEPPPPPPPTDMADKREHRRLSNMHRALTAEAFGDDSDHVRDAKRRLVIRNCTKGRTDSSTKCSVEELASVCQWLRWIKAGQVLVLQADGEWQLRLRANKGRAS